MFFTERLSLLLETGNALYGSLEALETQTGSEMRSIIADLRERVSGGQTFSQALANHPYAFAPTYINLVAAGEEGGFLHEVLERLRDMEERRQELRSTLTAAFSYPAFLVVFSVAVVLFVLIVVFPKFEEMFEMIRADLPVTTLILMSVSEVLRSYWAHILVSIVVAGVLLWRWIRTPEGAVALDRLMFRLPVVREIATQFQLVQFLYVLSLSLDNGVPLLDALRSCREIARSGSFQRFIASLEEGVNEGRGIGPGFWKADFLPPLVAQMVTTGEESGRLATVTGRMADFYEREWRKKLTLVSKIVEPVMLLVMGIVVGIIVSSLLLPIFKLSSAIH